MAIATGLCEVALICHGSTNISDRGGKRSRFAVTEVFGPTQFEEPYGVSTVGSYALAAQRHMHEYANSEQLAEIAVATRHWASMNPKARMRDRITIDDVLDSRLIASPLHLLDCCLVTDAGGAVVLTSLERARFEIQTRTRTGHWRGAHSPYDQPDAGFNSDGSGDIR